MHKTLLAVFIGASVFAVPAFAQVIPGGAGQAAAPSQTGASATGMSANPGLAIGAGDGTASTTDGAGAGTQALGLGGLLKQTQAHDAGPVADTPSEGAGPTGDLNAKAREKLRAARGH